MPTGKERWARIVREAKKAGGEKSVNLDLLQQETEQLLALLKDRQPGLVTWNELMRERLQSLRNKLGQALGK